MSNVRFCGFFATRFDHQTRCIGLRGFDLAEKLGTTYEHTRRLLRREALPSDSLLERISKVVKWNIADFRELVEIDKAHRRVRSLWQLTGRNAEMAEVYLHWPLLTPEQKSLFRVVVANMARENRKNKVR